MTLRYIAAIILMLTMLPIDAQIFNFSLKTNNQQLIDIALEGAFVKINQSYELCDTISNEHFGRNEKDYFSIIPFIGIETERGLIFPSATMMPWTMDKDFDEYKGQYKPIVTNSKLSLLNSQKSTIRSLNSNIKRDSVSQRLSILSESVQSVPGLMIDSISGVKDGWFIWLTSESDIVEKDSVKIISIKKEIEVPVDGEYLHIESPDLSGTVYGGIYVTPVQTRVGQLVFTLTGVLALDEEDWVIEFPFIKANKQAVELTPIEGVREKNGINQLIKKKK